MFSHVRLPCMASDGTIDKKVDELVLHDFDKNYICKLP